MHFGDPDEERRELTADWIVVNPEPDLETVRQPEGGEVRDAAWTT